MTHLTPNPSMGSEVASGSSAASGSEWIQRANARSIGQVEFRQVTMEIGTGRRARVLKIRILRESDGLVAKTVFCVMAPIAFGNINYVVTEHRGKIEPFIIQLYLPYALGSLRNLPTNRRREGHLGSDFAYDDFRTWLYEVGHQYRSCEVTGRLAKVRGTCVEGYDLVRHGTSPFDVWLDPGSAFVRGIDYWSPDGSEIVREYRAEDVTVVNGFEIAGRMTMLDRARNHLTTIRLERAWYNRPIDVSVFDSVFRKRTRNYLETL